jgi:hypothetical protein
MTGIFTPAYSVSKPDSTDDLFPAGNLDLQGTVGLRRAV